MSKTLLEELFEEDAKTILKELAESLGLKLVEDDEVDEEENNEPLYTVFIGEKEGNFKYPFLALNAEGKIRGYSEWEDIIGEGTDKIGKFTLDEVHEIAPQFANNYFLIELA